MLRDANLRPHPGRLDWQEVAFLAVILLAFGLRLFRLDSQSLWVDEATSAYLTRQSPVRVVLNRADSLHPPTYFLALAGWTALGGRSEFSLRFFSVWAGVLLVPLLYRVCKLVFDDARTGLVAGFLGALSPAGVFYCQETRMYALLPVAYVVVLGCVLVPNGLRKRRDWMWLAVTESLCLYLHSFSIFMLVGANVVLLLSRMRQAARLDWRRWCLSQGLAGLLGFNS